MSHLLQIIHMPGKKPNKVYDPHLKTGLAYENPEHLNKDIESQPKMYYGEKLESTKLIVDLPDYEETLEDTEKSRLKMKEMIQLDYAKLNALYESFVPQTEIPVEQTYFSSPSTSNVFSELSSEKSDLPSKKMPNKSKLLKLFVNLDNEIKQLGKLINISLQREKEIIVIYDEQNKIRKYFTQKVIQIVLWIVDSGCSKHITRNLKLLRNFIEKFMGTSTFEMITSLQSLYMEIMFKEISRYVTLTMLRASDTIFSVGQFCDGDLKVAFRSNTCYVWNSEGEDLLTSSLLSCVGSLCYPTNDRNDLGKMKPQANIGIFVGYSESSRGFCIYNHGTRKILETIHVKFNELTTMASECNNSGPGLNCSNFKDSSKEVNEIPSKEDLDNLFGSLYEQNYVMRTLEVSDNSAANTLNNEDTHLSSSIIIKDHDAPHIVSSSEEPIENEPTTPVFDNHSNCWD
ncbi:hypothetical protein Tco_1055699 [Tanacetum coccineum]|uniref:Retroviral polymerase SH3-like domain-containing protein n=1 Tax=Tanacetum coccineum TaxID=301880 RepID=A0ABQ5H277_9ASTR